MTDPSGTTTWDYDIAGRVISETKTIVGAPQPYNTQWTYDDLDNLRTMTHPENETVNVDYNQQGLPVSMWRNNGYYYVAKAKYNETYQLTDLMLGGVLTTTLNYFPDDLRLKQLKTVNASGSIQIFKYNYDNVGNVSVISDTLASPIKVSTFTYDDLDRLQTINVTGGTAGVDPYGQSFTYDSIGRISTRTTNSTTRYYSYDEDTTAPPFHVHGVLGVTPARNYGYDANGNATNVNGATLLYDHENHLTSFTSANGVTTTTYTYDGDGQRVRQVVTANGASTTTYYVGNHYEVSVSGATTTQTKYYYFGGQRIGVRVGATLSYIQGDHLGSTSVTANQSGTVLSRASYYGFGDVRTSSGTSPTDYGFTGQKLDGTGLMYYGARYYDPAAGRFIQADTLVPSPLNPQSLNRYSYVLNNPLRYTDPSGHVQCDESCGYESCGSAGCPGAVSGGSSSGAGSSGSGTSAQQETNSSPLPAETNPPPSSDDICNLSLCGTNTSEQQVAATATASAGEPPHHHEGRPPGLADVEPICVRDISPDGGGGGIACGGGTGEIGGGLGGGVGRELGGRSGGGGFAEGGGFSDPSPVRIGADTVPAGSRLTLGTNYTVNEGSLLNRVYDSRWSPGSPYSGPMGRSFSPGANWAPTAGQNIIDRGLPGWNNARMGIVYRATSTFPANYRTSIFGTAPEIFIDPIYQIFLKPMGAPVPIPP